MLGALVLGYIFYNSLFGALPAALFIPMYVKTCRERYDRRRKERLLDGFREGMDAVSVALRAGYSVENAFIEAGNEMGLIYDEDSDMQKFFVMVRGKLSVNKNLEDILYAFANESGVSDIISFAEVFAYAKRSGGNMVEIIQDTVVTISHKADTAREIAVLISAKQLEQMVMDVVPICIILYLRLTAPELIGRIYGNAYGIVMMTICMCVYAFAVFISLKIADIRV